MIAASPAAAAAKRCHFVRCSSRDRIIFVSSQIAPALDGGARVLPRYDIAEDLQSSLSRWCSAVSRYVDGFAAATVATRRNCSRCNIAEPENVLAFTN